MGRKKRVVVVGQDAERMEMLKFVLKTHGFCGTLTFSQEQALEAMQLEPADLVIVELGRQWEGVEIVKMLKLVQPETKRLLVSFEPIWVNVTHEASLMVDIERSGIKSLIYQVLKLTQRLEAARQMLSRKAVRRGSLFAV